MEKKEKKSPYPILSHQGRKGQIGNLQNSSPDKGRSGGVFGFTLVELIIVITILAILATIAFVSFQGYTSKSRDANRVATVKNIDNGINIFFTKAGKVPSPDTILGTGTIGGVTLGYVGQIGQNIARVINLNETPLDPQASVQYMYGVDANNKYYQIGLTLESQTALIPGIQESYAESGLQAKVYGNYIYPYKNGTKLYSLPSVLYTATGVLDASTKFVIDGGTNLPYQVGTQAGSGQGVAEVLQKITGTGNLSLTGVDLPSPLMTSAEFKADTTVPYPSAFSGVALALGIHDKTKLGVAVYGGKYVGDASVSGGGGSSSSSSGGSLALLSGLFTNIDGSSTPYIPDGATGTGRFTCVTGSCSNVVTQTGVVLDNITGLYWQSNGYATKYGGSADSMNWATAKLYCANLSLGGYTDWRLPDYPELLSIVDLTRFNPSINISFFSSANLDYWTSTTYASSTATAWLVGFNYGNSSYSYKTDSHYVRCTR